MNLLTFGVLLAILGIGSCDYKCVCNYNVEKSVQSSPSVQSNVMGYMYEFDCKPQAGASTDDEWIKVAYEHQLGYIEKDSQLQIQTCPGAIPEEDKLPVTSAAPTTVAETTFVASTTPTPTTVQVTTEPTTQTTTLPTTPAATTTETVTTTRPTTTSTTTLASTTAPTSTVPTTASTTTTKKPVTTTTTTTMTTTTKPTLKTTTQAPTTSSTTSTTTQTPSTTTNKPSTTQTTSKLPTTSTTRSTTTTRRTTTQLPSTTPGPSVLQGHIEMCPHRLQTLADQSREYIAQYAHNCYEIVQTRVSWSHAESNCKHNGGHLIHIASQQEQDFIYSFLDKHPSSTVWLGLHDRNQEENFEWTSGNPVTYTNWIPGRKDYRYHNSEDCVFMTTVKGQWDDTQCGGDNAISEFFQGIRHAYICQYATVLPPTTVAPTTVAPTTVEPLNFDGNTKMCPYSLRQQAIRDRGVLGQYDHSCYEIVPNTYVAWQHAEEICHNRGGHLTYISNIQEQAFVQGFLHRYSPNHAVWIGLTDQNSEGHFHWASGTPLQFTNWVPGHVSNYVSSSQEDCVVFIPYKSGQWDDIPCGSTRHSFFGGTSSSGETHPLLCQYPISAGPSLIG